ncbi:cell wall lytic activity [Sediminibacillus dalangtanensis]|uniref:Cell wall lytic activity n=1 Tax=Sediminibacillus dalangtanensis TaxID=2729421 RepID=A0ABX7VSV6_9BACI|nr:NlpC/P60 family protein [Sediminibacillus dalangtanensis]QTM99603.1 cell wall lytic activity [Sediminibacillus dalangtanensis]
MLTEASVQHVVKHSMSYGFVLTQPFAFYVDAYPVLENQMIKESNTLYYGQHNQSVKILQHKLSNLSFFSQPIDGDFGIYTEYALKKFQKEHDLMVSGRADKQTVEKLIIEERNEQLTPLREIDAALYPGETGKDIEKIQNALQYFGYYEMEVDGIFGPMTAQALLAFQKDNGVRPKERIDKATIEAFFAKENESAEVKEDLPEHAKPEPEQTAHSTTEKTEEVEEPEKTIPKPAEKASAAVEPAAVIQTAKQLVGSPYAWGGTSPDGFDCSGLIQYIYQTHGIKLPRTVNELWNVSKPVESPSIGDFVFFQTYKQGPSHMGIYVGDGKFLHAGESRGVEISNMDNPYWTPRYLGAKRLSIQP